MRVLVSGASGLIGRALCHRLQTDGDDVRVLVRDRRSPANPSSVYWNPGTGEIDAQGAEGLDAVVHLAGENIASGRWTEEKKNRIYSSRVRGTSLLSAALAACSRPPRVLISSSAVGYYGHRGDEELDESSARGEGFLAETCHAWEEATQTAAQAGIRVVRLRTGMVLSGAGGALPRMLLPFKMGLGGPIGNGNAWMSWVSLEDMVSIIIHCMNDPSLSGPVNAVVPQPVSNRSFTKSLGRVLARPACLPVPPRALKLIFGEMAGEVLLASIRVMPQRLNDTGFHWKYPDIEPALRACLEKHPPIAG